MLNVHQISDALEDLGQGFSVDDFERWLRRESRNVHKWGDENIKQAVLAIEAVLSEYRFANLPEDAAKQELANAIRPFVFRRQVRVVAMSSASPQEIQLGNAPNRKKARSETVTVRCFAQGM